MSEKVIYAREQTVDVEDFRQVLIESGLGTIEPVDDLARLEANLAGASLIVTARLNEPGQPLVGVARSLTDFSWVCYLSEIAVSPTAQGLGIGKGLLDETRKHLGPGVSLVLDSVPEAVGFYERVGMERLPNAFRFKREF